MYHLLDIRIGDLPVRYDLYAMSVLEKELGIGWYKDIPQYDYDKLTNIFSVLIREGIRYLAFQGSTYDYQEPEETELYLFFSKYSLSDLRGLLFAVIQESTLTEDEKNEDEIGEDDIQILPERMTNTVKKEEKGINFFQLYYYAQSEFNLTLEQAKFLYLAEWKYLYKEYKNKFDLELALRLNRKTYAMAEQEEKQNLDFL